MKHHRITLAIAVLVLATLACQTVMGGVNRDAGEVPVVTVDTFQQDDVQPTVAPPEAATETSGTEDGTGGTESTISSQFPLTGDAYNIVEMGDGSLVYYTKLSTEEAMQFFRDEYTAKGYAERKDLTMTTDGMFSMVFDGDPSGKAVVVQSVDLGDGSRTIAIRLEDV